MPAYKEKGKKQINAHSIFKYNQSKTEIPTSIYKMGAPSVKLPLKSWFTLSTVVYTNVYNGISIKRTHYKADTSIRRTV